MSIKPDVYLMASEFNAIKAAEDEYAAHSCWLTKNYVGFRHEDFVGLYAIPDTHMVVSVSDLLAMQWAFEDHRAGFMVDKIRAIIEDKQP